MTPTERRQALGHKAMNLYQVQMYQLEQSSELVTFEPDEIPTDYDYQTKIYVKNENLLYRLHQFGSQVKVGCMNFADP
ncbi:MAG: TIGR02452 family protein, partial [Ligilactobacillus agilis]|nr:TIGR02452 family protein [Ligilactobacillus agilis]